jgi:DNA-binding transcriptional regulator GbsR (MarR family)
MATPHPAVRRFIERLGLATEAEGLPRTAGRILAYLLVRDQPTSADDLIEFLQISRGGVSGNTRLLETLGMVERVSKPGDRRDYYQVAPDPYGRLIQGQVERMRGTARIVAECREELPQSLQDTRKRLGQMERFYRYAISETERFLAGWARERAKA